ncbi:helix-turn-helix transcriptional regulator [Limosilactobacillus fermentum]|uniref:helix-turn-helix transcriptional regulator n=1 Tax=Limosilactobacillus fermentum TaxID=1613 RepID=UPI003D76E5B4
MKANFVAKQIGISPSYLSQVMNGSRNLSSDVAIRASQVLGLSLDIFLDKS